MPRLLLQGYGPLLREHLPGGGAADQERALQVRVEHAVPLVLVHLHDRAVGVDASVADADVKSAEAADGPVDRALNGLRVADVGGLAEDVMAVGAQPLDDGRRVARVVVEQRDAVAGLGEARRDPEADAVRRAGDQDAPGATAIILLSSHDGGGPHVSVVRRKDRTTFGRGLRRGEVRQRTGCETQLSEESLREAHPPELA